MIGYPLRGEFAPRRDQAHSPHGLSFGILPSEETLPELSADGAMSRKSRIGLDMGRFDKD